MPYLTKSILNHYIRSDCKRQLRLYLSPDNATYRAERIDQGMPPPQPPRPGLEQIAQQGEAWEAEKLDDLTRTFGAEAIIGNRITHSSGQVRYNEISLTTALDSATPGNFLIQAQYAVGPTFEHALGIESFRTDYDLRYAEVRPDILQVLPANHFSQYVEPSGEIRTLPQSDLRLQLRIIDIKLTAEPSPAILPKLPTMP